MMTTSSPMPASTMVELDITMAKCHAQTGELYDQIAWLNDNSVLDEQAACERMLDEIVSLDSRLRRSASACRGVRAGRACPVRPNTLPITRGNTHRQTSVYLPALLPTKVGSRWDRRGPQAAGTAGSPRA